MIDNFLLTNVKYGEHGLYVNYKTHTNHGKFFWSNILMRMFHRKKINMISRKSLILFMEHVNTGKEKKIMLKNNIKCYMKDFTLYILFGKYCMTKIPKNISTLHSIQKSFSNYIVQIDEVLLSYDDSMQLTETISEQDIIDGHYKYIMSMDSTNTYSVNKKLTGIIKKQFLHIPLILCKDILIIMPTEIQRNKYYVVTIMAKN